MHLQTILPVPPPQTSIQCQDSTHTRYTYNMSNTIHTHIYIYMYTIYKYIYYVYTIYNIYIIYILYICCCSVAVDACLVIINELRLPSFHTVHLAAMTIVEEVHRAVLTHIFLSIQSMHGAEQNLAASKQVSTLMKFTRFITQSIYS